MEKTYNPQKIEPKIYSFWEKDGFFNPDRLPGKRKKAFVVTMAPPNITGHIHVGHALENTLLDILIRQKRMQGYKTLFLPGKDHASIAAQYVVEKQLQKEGLTRFDLGKERFVKRMWQWMKEYGSDIDQELKKLGLSCDWSRLRFTMDKNYQAAVKQAFKHYKNKGWIYRGKRMVNWCSRCGTNISDLEVQYQERKGKLWFLKYPILKNPKFEIRNYIVVATTRPETMLGDAAVAVNPQDKRYKDLIGKTAILPIQNREIPIIADKLVNAKFGTGAVKVTPAHDNLDFEIGQKHKLPFYYVINEKSRMTKEATVCRGLSVEECRTEVLKILKNKGLVKKEEAYVHNIGLCDRCKTVIEPLISEQWFLSMKELAKIALRAAKENKIKFIPAQRKRIFINWFNNIKDWNISRQLWWGQRLPVWLCQTGKLKSKIKNQKSKIDNEFFISIKKPSMCPLCGRCQPKQTPDVFDAWFSSALWPFATLGWPKKTKDLKEFYPTTLISSAREIFFLWIARMAFSGLEFMKKVPFQISYTHPTILDEKGRKMSKSLGNVVDPMELIEKYGADATRFGLIWQTTGVQDIHWSEDGLLAGKKFCNKIWNASRFVLGQIGKSQIPSTKFQTNSKFKTQNSKQLTMADKKILKTLTKTIKAVNKDLEKFRFGHALRNIYNFFWHDFCDRYIEESKKQNDEKTKKILLYVLLNSLKILHPFLPHITEEIYQRMEKEKKRALIIEKWPTA